MFICASLFECQFERPFAVPREEREQLSRGSLELARIFPGYFHEVLRAKLEVNAAYQLTCAFTCLSAEITLLSFPVSRFLWNRVAMRNVRSIIRKFHVEPFYAPCHSTSTWPHEGSTSGSSPPASPPGALVSHRQQYSTAEPARRQVVQTAPDRQPSVHLARSGGARSYSLRG